MANILRITVACAILATNASPVYSQNTKRNSKAINIKTTKQKEITDYILEKFKEDKNFKYTYRFSDDLKWFIFIDNNYSIKVPIDGISVYIQDNRNDEYCRGYNLAVRTKPGINGIMTRQDGTIVELPDCDPGLQGCNTMNYDLLVKIKKAFEDLVFVQTGKRELY